MLLILGSCKLTERTVFVICLSMVMIASIVTANILTVEFAIIKSIPTTQDGLFETELLKELKLINSDLVNLKRTVVHPQTSICNAVFQS